MSPTPPRVLLIGYRSGLRAALETLGLPFAIWSDVAIRRPLPDVSVLIHPFGATRDTCAQALQSLQDSGPFTHVIAGTEASVVCASHVRHLLGCRRSAHTVAHRCHDKLHMKQALARHAVPMAPFLNGHSPHSEQEITAALGLPVVVKDRTSSGGRGMEILTSLPSSAALRWPGRILEAFVEAEEISVESFVNHGEVLFENVTNYHKKRFINVVPAPPDAALREAAIKLNRQVIAALRIEWGITHLEMFTIAEGPLFGEIALRPPGGYIMDAMALAYNFDPWSALVSVELDLPFAWPSEASAASAAVLFHPGCGSVVSIDGLDAARSDPYVRSLRLRVKPGEHVASREGLADVGRALVRAPDHMQLSAAIERLVSTLRISIA